MDCKKCRDLMNSYMDHTLSAEQERELLVHTQSCEQCRSEFEAYRSMRSVFAAPPEIRLPDGFEDRIYQKIDAFEKASEKAKKPFYLRRYAMGSIAACMVAGLFLSSYFYSGIRPGFDQQQLDNPPIVAPSAQPADGYEAATIPEAEPSILPETTQEPKSEPTAPANVSKTTPTPRPTVKPTPKADPTPPPVNSIDNQPEEDNNMHPQQTVAPTPTPSPVQNGSTTVKPFAKSALASTRIQISKDTKIKSLLTKNGISYTDSNDKIIVESASYDRIERILQENDISYTPLDDVGNNANLIVFILE